MPKMHNLNLIRRQPDKCKSRNMLHNSWLVVCIKGMKSCSHLKDTRGETKVITGVTWEFD